MVVVAQDPSVEPPLEEMAHACVASVEALGVATVQAMEPRRQICEICLDDRVIVVAHQAIGVADPAAFPPDGAEVGDEGPTIVVVAEDLAPRNHTARDVINAIPGKHATR